MWKNAADRSLAARQKYISASLSIGGPIKTYLELFGYFFLFLPLLLINYVLGLRNDLLEFIWIGNLRRALRLFVYVNKVFYFVHDLILCRSLVIFFTELVWKAIYVAALQEYYV